MNQLKNYMKTSIKEELTEYINENKDKILSIIKENIDNNILICCYNGKSISPFIVSLFIEKYSNYRNL